MAFKIGLQVYSVRDYAEKDFKGTMRAIKAMGFDGVELAGMYDNSPQEIKEALEENNLELISAHIHLKLMLEKGDELFGIYKDLGARYVVMPWLDETMRPGTDKFPEVVEQVNMLGAKARLYGLQLLYHNHDFEFEKIDGEYALDMLYRVIPSENLMTEIDTCWVNVGGEDPADYILKYQNKSPIVHLKDFYQEKGASREGMYELIGVDKKASAATAFELRPLGHGMQNFPKIIDAAKEAGTEWLIVEQDNPSMGLSSMACAETSRKFLRELGY